MILLLKNLLFTVLVPGTVAGWIPYRMVAGRGGLVLPRSWTAWPGAALFVIGLAVYGWCVWDFAVTGRGTPAPIDAPKTLVVRGLYRWVRNPMYVGVLCVIGGWTVTFRSQSVAVYGGIVWVFFFLFVLLVEEPMLRRRFGPEYAEYCRTVRRWIPASPRRA